MTKIGSILWNIICVKSDLIVSWLIFGPGPT